MTGTELRERRKKLGLSQAALAAYWGVIQATISNWETGRHEIQHPRILNDALCHLERTKAVEKSS